MRLVRAHCRRMVVALRGPTAGPALIVTLPNARRELEKGTGPICRNGPSGASHTLDLSPFPRAIQIFATDLDKDAIEKARRGVFSVGIAADVSPERLARFFVHEDECYRICKEVRDLVVFAPQNLLVDPPFTKVDILCCRNLMIYVNAQTQKKLLPLLHYALNPGGLLILGTAEGIGGSDRLFSPLDQKRESFSVGKCLSRPASKCLCPYCHASARLPRNQRNPEYRTWTLPTRRSERSWTATALPRWWSMPKATSST